MSVISEYLGQGKEDPEVISVGMGKLKNPIPSAPLVVSLKTNSTENLGKSGTVLLF